MAAPLQHKPVALIAEDDGHTRETLRSLAVERGFGVVVSDEGAPSIEAARSHRPDVIFLDLVTPHMDGLQALQRIREADPSVPVIIVAADPEPERLERAFAMGAVNLVRKPFDLSEIQFVLDRIYRTLEEEAELRDVLYMIETRKTQLSFASETGILSKVVAYLGRELVNGYPGFDVPITEIKLALYEALANAFEHGNLEITFAEKSEALQRPRGIEMLFQQRLSDPRLAGRRIHVAVDYQPGRALYRIRDEGLGFDPEVEAQKPMAATTALHGRGITLIRHYMDEVSWNTSGNEIRLAKYLRPRKAAGRASAQGLGVG